MERMMKWLVHIFFLLAVIALVALRSVGGEAIANKADLWIFVVCITVTVVDAALAIAASFTQRPVLDKTVWACTFFVLGCALWAVRMFPPDGEEDMYDRIRQQENNPYVQDEEGETLFTRAAALGKDKELRRMIQQQAPTMNQLIEAGYRAAEGNHVAVLEELARVGLSASATRDGTPLLHAAAQNGRCDAIRWLIMRGAAANGRDADGSTALIQAAQSGSVAAVRLLLELGADAKLRDATGLRAEDYARDREMYNLLAPPANPDAAPSQQSF